jgi:hypothetical protein
VTLKNAVFCDVARCGDLVRTNDSVECAASIFGVERIGKVLSTDVVPRSRILSTLKIEVIRSSITLVLTSHTRRHISEDGVLRKFPNYSCK